MISALFLYWKDASGPRDSRIVGALGADPEGRGGVSGVWTPVLFERSNRPEPDARTSAFEGS